MLVLVLGLSSCAIEPPLHLAGEADDIVVEMPMVITDLELIWNVEANWQQEWHYGWDATDVQYWGKLEYPVPTNFEVRNFFLGDNPYGEMVGVHRFTVYGDSFRQRLEFGYYNMLLWSNIDSPDGTQTVVINEGDLRNIYATTSNTRVEYTPKAVRSRVVQTHNQPEIFYSARVNDLYVSRDVKDYDYFNEKEQVWVKRINTEMIPVVYVYLVQAVIHNNRNRIVQVADHAIINGLADGVNLTTGETSQRDANVTFDMRMKTGVDVNGETCDIVGGKLNTYGLCGMSPWTGRSGRDVTRFDIENTLSLCLRTRSGNTLVLSYDLTEAMRKRARGGVLTVHIDADDIRELDDEKPTSGFDPTIEKYDEIVYEFDIE